MISEPSSKFGSAQAKPWRAISASRSGVMPKSFRIWSAVMQMRQDGADDQRRHRDLDQRCEKAREHILPPDIVRRLIRRIADDSSV